VLESRYSNSGPDLRKFQVGILWYLLSEWSGSVTLQTMHRSESYLKLEFNKNTKTPYVYVAES